MTVGRLKSILKFELNETEPVNPSKTMDVGGSDPPSEQPEFETKLVKPMPRRKFVKTLKISNNGVLDVQRESKHTSL